MAFTQKCEECGEDINKTESLSIFQSFLEGGIIECKKCKTRYKSKYKTAVLDGMIPIFAIVVIAIMVVDLLLFFVGVTLKGMIIPTLVLFVLYNILGTYLMPLKKIDKKDELFFDIKDEF
ncbi:hypothetical protein H2279_03910 [Campylobacter sp. B0100352/1]|uniref:hypothetical protein n=1 Tax=Campylobacter sp. B0100352/1 TaxID=2735783 RepID=UPI001D2ACE83|nr:hypothetical protein [Campylobacter sp. B0100352/1]